MILQFIEFFMVLSALVAITYYIGFRDGKGSF